MAFNSKKYERRFSKDEAKVLAEKFCAYQERCHQEVRTRLYEYGLATDDVEEIIFELIQSNYLNEERFAKAYVKGKFNQKKWGRIKIKTELKRRQISPYCITKGLEEIDSDLYEQTMISLIEKKARTLKGGKAYIKNQKIANYLQQKGFEGNLIWELIKRLESE